MSDTGKSVDEIMVGEMQKARGAAGAAEAEARWTRHGMGEMLDVALKYLPSGMVRSVCERHGYTLLDNGNLWSKKKT